MIFGIRAAVGIIDNITVFLRTFSRFHLFIKSGGFCGLVYVVDQECKPCRRGLTAFKPLTQQPFGITHKMVFFSAYNSYKTVFPLCFGIFNCMLQEGFAVTISFLFTRNPETIHDQEIGRCYRHPGFFRRSIFNKHFCPFIYPSKNIPLIKFFLQPLFFCS